MRPVFAAFVVLLAGCQLSPPRTPSGPDTLAVGEVGTYKSKGHGPAKYHHWDWYVNDVKVRNNDDYKESFSFSLSGTDLVCRGRVVLSGAILPVTVRLTCTESCPLAVFWTDKSKPKLIRVIPASPGEE